MMPKALIINGVVDTISFADVEDANWIKIPEGVYSGFKQNKDGTFTAPPAAEPSTNPVDYPLNPAQFEAVLSLLNVTTIRIDEAIDQLPLTDDQKVFAKAKVRKANCYCRDSELIKLLVPLIGIDAATIDIAWMRAKKLR